MARDPKDEREVFEAFSVWCATNPDAAVLLGIVRDGGNETSVVTQFGLVNCGPVELVAAANDLLGAAAESLRASRHESAPDFLQMVEDAIDALGFQQPDKPRETLQ